MRLCTFDKGLIELRKAQDRSKYVKEHGIYRFFPGEYKKGIKR